MDKATLAAQARKHWETWLPQKTAELKAAREFTEASEAAAALALKEAQHLMRQGAKEHEALEIVLPKFILLEPEPPAEDDWEAVELAEKERQYQEMMQDPPEPE